MARTITSEIIRAYSQCPRKAFLLLCKEEKGTPHEYVQILQQKQQDSQKKYIENLKLSHIDVRPFTPNNFVSGSDFLVNVILEAEGLVADCGILTRVDSSSALGNFSYEPTLFIGTHSISKEQKLELGFVGWVLGKLQSRIPEYGCIVNVAGNDYKLELKAWVKLASSKIADLQEWVKPGLSEMPAIIINKHCQYCHFRKSCLDEAEKEDNISLLSGVTFKLFKKYTEKGIFTIKQLSYLFKVRRSRIRKTKPYSIHKPELQALAIRTNKIYVQQLPSLVRKQTELFLDIEGVPDRRFYYLIGLIVSSPEDLVYHGLWADAMRDEEEIWSDFLKIVRHYPDANIYHYGRFDLDVLNRLSNRYEVKIDDITGRLININEMIYGGIFFPARTNSLKDVAQYLGAKWSSENASGIQSLVWRHHWDETHGEDFKHLLLTYNEEDCRALKLVTDTIFLIQTQASTLPEIDFVNQPKKQSTDIGKDIHDQLSSILEFAHNKYNEKKIKFRTEDTESDLPNRKRRDYKKGYQGQRKIKPKPNKVINVPTDEVCPSDGTQLVGGKRISSRLIIDLTLTKSGIKKIITEYTGNCGYCPQCHKTWPPLDIRKFKVNQLYGHAFQSWVVYQRIALKMTYNGIAESMAEQFDEHGPKSHIGKFIVNLGHYYAETEEIIIQKLLESPYIHVDETPIRVDTVTQYVWTFATEKFVIFRLTKTREATIAHKLLEGYQGILISDFYAGYDTVKCQQQKCWVHFVRDLNDDLWRVPYDVEYETFVSQVRDLIIPIIQDVRKYGLKKECLSRFKVNVNEFYTSSICDVYYRSETVIKYQKRFSRYRESLFSFIDNDSVPWHNNTAERALRHIVKQQQISEHLTETVTPDYLKLLGIRQTLHFQGKSFLKFLFS